MLVAFAYRLKMTDGRCSWGNDTIQKLLEQFPRLSRLVKQLKKEGHWSARTRSQSQPWTSLFFVDYANSPPTVSLEIKAPQDCLCQTS